MIDNLIELTQKLETEVVAYKAKPTKACSARIRKLTLAIGKDGPSIRSSLIAADRKGY